jgi:NAD(P)-dependent dehydrogenase (short-subunit alcohol dehydrogenase family)
MNKQQTHGGTMGGRTVLVTGGTGGIGRATALGLTSMGAHVALTGRDRDRAEGVAREVRAVGAKGVDVFVADLSAQSEVRRLADEVLQDLGSIHVLVNNVGGYWNTRHVTADGLERTFALNHLAPRRPCPAVTRRRLVKRCAPWTSSARPERPSISERSCTNGGSPASREARDGQPPPTRRD